jgi:hypothetical protein
LRRGLSRKERKDNPQELGPEEMKAAIDKNMVADK